MSEREFADVAFSFSSVGIVKLCIPVSNEGLSVH